MAEGAELRLDGNGQINESNGSILGGGAIEHRGVFESLGTYDMAISENVGISTFTSDAQAGTLIMTAGTLRGEGTFTIGQSLEWSSGKMSGPGRTVSQGEFLLDGTTARRISDDRIFDNAGALTWAGIGSIGIESGGVFNNLAGATMDLQADAFFTKSGGADAFLNNEGDLIKSAGEGIFTFDLPVRNSGAIEAQMGQINFAEGFIQTAGSVVLAGGGFRVSRSANMIELQGGELSGAGSVQASVVNGARVIAGSPLGVLTCNNFAQTIDGELSIQIDGPIAGTDTGQLAITGDANFSGTLALSLGNGYEPNVGDRFEIVTYALRVGEFASVTGSDLGNGKAFTLDYQPTGLFVEVVDSP